MLFCTDWIKKQNFKPKVEQNALDTLGACGGETFDDITSKEDLEDHGVKKAFRAVILNAINKLKEESGVNTQQLFDKIMKKQEEKNNGQSESEFHVMFNASSNKCVKSRQKFKLTDTVFDLKQYWVDHERGGNVSDLILLFNTKQYSSDKNAVMFVLFVYLVYICIFACFRILVFSFV